MPYIVELVILSIVLILWKIIFEEHFFHGLKSEAQILPNPLKRSVQLLQQQPPPALSGLGNPRGGSI